MKKIIATALAASLMLLGTSAFAQISVGAGYVNSTDKITSGSTTHSSVPGNGFYAGAEYLISEGNFGISVGAYYSYITSTNSDGITIFGINLGAGSKYEDMYLDAPVRFNISGDITPSLKGIVFAGPTFSYGISSTSEYSATIGTFGGNSDKIDNYADGSLNRFDILVGGGVGVEYNSKIRFTVGYDFGMLNKLDSDTSSQTRNVLKAGLAFLF